MAHHNTTNLNEQNLRLKIAACKNQDKKISTFFKEYPDKMFTPFEIHSAIFDESTPITSVRRSITGLTKKGILIKTNIQKDGNFGMKTYCWQLNSFTTFLKQKDLEKDNKINIKHRPEYVQSDLFKTP